MTSSLVRGAHRQVRLTPRRLRHDPPDDWVVYSFVEPDDEPPCSLPRLITWFGRFQEMHRVIIFVCLFSIWLPLIKETSSRSMCTIEPLLNASNITQGASLLVPDPWFDFTAESLVNWLTVFCCVGAVVFSIPRHVCKLNQMDSRLLIPLIFSSILHQLGTGLITRPLEILTDPRFQSMLIFQIIGFLFCLFCAFTLGVLYVAYPGVDLTESKEESTVSE